MKDRPIKFRAWDKDSKIMFVDIQDGIDFDDGSHYKFSDFLETEFRWSVAEFTGFFGQNGKEIYEGDILNFGGYNLVVVFQKGEFVGKFIEEIDEDNMPGYIIRHEAHQFEVVGNIFENPELVSSNSLLKKNEQKNT